MNGDEMTLGIVICVDVMHPVFPCAIYVAVSRAQCGLELAVRVLSVKRLFGMYLNGPPGFLSAHPPSP